LEALTTKRKIRISKKHLTIHKILIGDLVKMMFPRITLAALFLAVPAAAITCGPNTAITMTGSSAVVPVAQAWAKVYSAACGNSISVTSQGTTSGGGSIAGAQDVCSGSVDIGLLSRQLISPSEATQNIKNPFLYTCKGRTLYEIQVAIDGLAFLSAPNGIAAKCIASLAGGGLTFSQIRWMYSSFSLAKLKSDPLFDPLAVPNSDGSDATHYWSELCSGSGCNCPKTEIGIAGSPSSSGTYTFFAEKIFRGSGETVRSGYQSDSSDSQSYVVNLVTASGNSATIGYTLFAPYNNNANSLYAAAVQDPDDGVYRFPTFAQFSTGEYPASFFLYMEVASNILSAVQDFFVYAFSDAGNNAVINTGILPIPGIAAVQMLSRLGATGGVSLSGINCGPGGSIFQGGSSTVYPLAYLWGNVYGDACGLTVTTLSGGSTFGAQLSCGIPDPVSGSTADIGTLSRLFASSEAFLPSGGNGFDYKCLIGTKRTVRQFPVAIDGITFAFPLSGNAASCLATLTGKGLTIDQLRWMYSSYGYSQLVANGWNANSVPGYTASTTANHFWSYLGGSGCSATEIAIAGSPSTSGTYSFLTGVLFKGSETIALNRPTGYYNVPEDNPNEVVQYLQATPASIGYFGFSYYSKNSGTLGASTVKNSAGNYVFPSENTFGDNSYNPFTRNVYMELSTVFLTFQKTVAFVQFGITSSVGDTLTRAAGLTPLSTATKANYVTQKRYTLSVPCFSETATVQVMDKGVTAMKDLKIGDMVMNAEGKYDAVYSFGHYAPEIAAEFVQIHAAGLKTPLEISKEHMLFVDGAAVPASFVSVGDKVNLVGGAVAEVKKIQSVVRHGAYAPFTVSGTIAVNNVAASVYVDLQNNAGVLIIGGYKTPLSMQFLAHMFQAPHRLVCMMSPAYCQTETYTEEGISAWVAGPLAVAEWVIQQNVVLMTLAFVPCFLAGVAIYAFELMLASKMLLLIAVASLLAVRAAKKTSRKEV
jgi:ABC-type phosphate transport system substrate-binding protein